MKTVLPALSSLVALLAAAAPFGVVGSVNLDEGKGPALVIDTNKIVGARVDMKDSLGKASRKKAEEKVRARQTHARTDICLDFSGEKLTWGDVEDYVDLQLLEAPLNIPPEATVEQVQQIIARSKVRLEEIAINAFLRDALLAVEAKKCGLSVSDAELAAALNAGTAKSLKKATGEKIVPKLLDPNGYFARKQRNYILTKKYRDSVLAPALVVSSNDIAVCMAARHQANEDAAATNQLLKARIEDFLAKIKAGELDFGETAYEFSDCGSCMTNGDWGEFDRDCSLLQPLKDFIFAPSRAEMSEIIETPYSYHIVKILQRYYDEDEESGTSEAPEAPAAPVERGLPHLHLAAVLVAAALVVSLVIGLFLRERPVSVRVFAHVVVWVGAAAVGAVLFFRASRGEVRAPTRVHVAHIMLEKATILPELDAAAAFQEAKAKKLGAETLAAQRRVLEVAQTNGTLTCGVPITLLKNVKLKKQKESVK